MATIMTQLSALSIAVNAFRAGELPEQATCEQVADVLAHMVDKREQAAVKAGERRKASGASRTAVRNAQLVADVVVPFVDGCAEPVTAKVVCERIGHAEILTSQKAAVLLKLATQQGAIQRVEFPKGVSNYAPNSFDGAAWAQAKQAERDARKAKKAKAE